MCSLMDRNPSEGGSCHAHYLSPFTDVSKRGEFCYLSLFIMLHSHLTKRQEDYDRLRPLSYQNTNMVLICYDVMNPTSYDNVLIKWYPEVSHFCRGVPLILIGCKTDLRKDKEHLRKLMSSEQEPITYNQGEAACQQMKAQAYLECSAKCRENIEDIFKEATNIALNAMKKAKRRKKRKRCSIL
ncbi:rho-related GTP-binding protein RhoF isoform X2 [Mauremys reevesii]|uniref:rho-related GTP-binding protein RhoF isoform X2 n=1 Tax=Mauremys reevesii TaxID=260615 RepID=UPI00193F0687|nr:rho-related GTP-binding protein RhoF isoform X2 [Mauremys reevesii]